MLQIQQGATTGNTYTELKALSGGWSAWNNLILQSGGGNVGIGVVTPLETLHVDTSIRISDNETANTNKSSYITASQYNSGAETEGFIAMRTYAPTGVNAVRLGGGHSSWNTATEITFYTAADATTREGTERMRIDSAGNVGIGVTPESWQSGWTALQIGATSALQSVGGTQTVISENLYRDSVDSRWERIEAGGVSYINLENGTIQLQVANATDGGSGADSAISWTTGLSIADTGNATFAGNVGIGVSPQGTQADFTSLSLGGTGYISTETSAGAGKNISILQNAHYDTDGSWEYISTDEASRYKQGCLLYTSDAADE